MKDFIKERLEIINTIYTKERIDKTKERTRNLFNKNIQITDYPVCHYPMIAPYYDIVHDKDDWIKKHLDEIIFHGYLEDDFVPSIFPGCKISTIPSLFGAEESIVNGDVNVSEIVKSPSDIDNLEYKIRPNTAAAFWLEFQKYILEETEGQLPIHVVDMQGACDACGKIWNYSDFLALAYDDPEKYHKFANIVTDAFIFYWEEQKKLLGDLFVPTHLYGWNWRDANNGATMSIDSIVMISPSFYEEFYKPYIIKIGEHFNGVTIHSCGWFNKVVPNICETPYIDGINAGQMSIKELVDSGITNNIVIIPILQENNFDIDLKLIKENNLRVNLNVVFNNSEEYVNTKNYTKIKDKIKKIKDYLNN